MVPGLGNLATFPQAATNIYQGMAVGLNSSGYAIAWALGLPFIGHATRSSDNSAGAAGDKKIEVMRGMYLLEVSLANVTITDAYRQAAVFMADNGSGLSLRAGQMVGHVVQYLSSGKALVLFNTFLTIHCLAETVTKAAMTDVTTTGTWDFLTSIPAGSQVIGCEFDVRTAFAGDTSAVIQVGIAGNLDNFTALTTVSVFTTGVKGVQAPGATDNTFLAAATAPRVTITSAADFTNTSAGGEVDVKVLYIPVLRS